mmetsp:Transcript_16535/g.34743  ORF Transcript_16535/g.34743 Transcript_16535/m.34743 type:complete len:230 (+) Transcript_16535:563-1252(+)
MQRSVSKYMICNSNGAPNLVPLKSSTSLFLTGNPSRRVSLFTKSRSSAVRVNPKTSYRRLIWNKPPKTQVLSTMWAFSSSARSSKRICRDDERKGFSVFPVRKRQGPPLTDEAESFLPVFSFCNSSGCIRFVLLRRNLDVSRIEDAEFVAKANDQSPSRRLESVVVDTGLDWTNDDSRSSIKSSRSLRHLGGTTTFNFPSYFASISAISSSLPSLSKANNSSLLRRTDS